MDLHPDVSTFLTQCHWQTAMCDLSVLADAVKEELQFYHNLRTKLESSYRGKLQNVERKRKHVILNADDEVDKALKNFHDNSEPQKCASESGPGDMGASTCAGSTEAGDQVALSAPTGGAGTHTSAPTATPSFALKRLRQKTSVSGCKRPRNESDPPSPPAPSAAARDAPPP